MNADKELDTRGLNCPMPIMKAKKAMTEINAGQVLKVISTDPGSVKDFDAFVKQTGYEMLGSSQAGNDFIFFIKKK